MTEGPTEPSVDRSDLTDRYEALLAAAGGDANVLGVVLSGSRVVTEFVTPHSDFDVYVVQREEHAADYPFVRGSGLETVTVSLEGFERHARFGTPTWWNRPSFLFARLELDRTPDGDVARLLERKRRLDDVEAAELIGSVADDYIKMLYRSLKNFRDGRSLAGRLDAADTISPLLHVAFALEGRVRPFNKWLEYALAIEPLALPDLLARVRLVLDTGDPAVQRSLFRDVESRLREQGHGGLVDSWAPDVPFLQEG
jgi:hypothetical protein